MLCAVYTAEAHVARSSARMHFRTVAGKLLHWTRTAARKGGSCRAVAADARQSEEAVDSLIASIRAGQTANSRELQYVLARLAAQKRYNKSREVIRLASDAGASDRVQLWRRLLDEIRMNGTRAELQWAEKDMHETLCGGLSDPDRNLQQRAAEPAKAVTDAGPGDGRQADRWAPGAAPRLGASAGYVDPSKLSAVYAETGRDVGFLVEIDEILEDGTRPTKAYFEALMKRAEAASDTALAERILRHMRSVGVTPNEMTVFLLASAHRRRGFHMHAEARYRQLLGEFKIRTTELSLNGLILAYSEAGRLDDARRLLSSMGDLGVLPTARTYNSLMTGPAKGGDVKFIEATIQQMEGAGIAATHVSLGLLLQALAVRGEGEQARLVFDTMEKTRGIAPNQVHRTLLIEAFCRQGGPSGLVAAEQALRESKQRSVRSYLPLTRAYSQLCDEKSVLRLVRQMVLDCGGTVPQVAFRVLRNHLVRARYGISETDTRRAAALDLHRLLQAPGAVD